MSVTVMIILLSKVTPCNLVVTKDSGGMICLQLYSLNQSLAHSSETLLP